MKRSLSFILMLALLSTVSCGSGGSTGTDSTAPQTQPEAETTEKPYADNLGEYNFGGSDYNILVRETRIADLFCESETGDIVDDALYKRSAKVEERFNIKIKTVTLPDDSSVWNNTLQGDVMSNSGDYDLVMPDYWWGCESRGLFLNLLDFDVLDFSQPYWCAGWNDNAIIYGQLYNAVGSLSLDLIKNDMAVFISSKLIEELKLESPYELVKSRKWTLDKLLEMSAAALSDLNGDGDYDWDNDRIGFGFGTHAGRGLAYSFGIQMASKTADNSYEFKFMNESFVEKYEKIYSLVNDNDAVGYADCGGRTGMGTDLYPGFKNDNLLFLATGIRATDDMRDMVGDYGIVPYPLYNDSQKDYITYNLGTAFMSILLSAPDPEMSAVILEALNAENYKSVVPAYLDVALKGKYSRDDNTAEMLDLILDTTYFDFAFVNDSSIGIVPWMFNQVTRKNESIASVWESNRVSFETKLNDLLETYRENME